MHENEYQDIMGRDGQLLKLVCTKQTEANLKWATSILQNKYKSTIQILKNLKDSYVFIEKKAVSKPTESKSKEHKNKLKLDFEEIEKNINNNFSAIDKVIEKNKQNITSKEDLSRFVKHIPVEYYLLKQIEKGLMGDYKSYLSSKLINDKEFCLCAIENLNKYTDKLTKLYQNVSNYDEKLNSCNKFYQPPEEEIV